MYELDLDSSGRTCESSGGLDGLGRVENWVYKGDNASSLLHENVHKGKKRFFNDFI